MPDRFEPSSNEPVATSGHSEQSTWRLWQTSRMSGRDTVEAACGKKVLPCEREQIWPSALSCYVTGNHAT
jgi:hypothetical protein